MSKVKKRRRRREVDLSLKERIVHVHSSSRYSRSAASLVYAIRDYIERTNADILTFTEVATESRERPLYSFDGYGAVTGDVSLRNDAGIMYKESVWTKVKEWNHEIATSSWFTKKRGFPMPNVAATSVILEHVVTGKRLLVSVAHMPPGVQGTRGFKGAARRLTAWVSALDGWRRFWHSHRREVDGIMIVADWNVNLRYPWVRAYFKQHTPTFDTVWEGREFPKRGEGTTRGGQIIDFTLIRGKLVRLAGPRILPDDNSSDHRPYRETLAL